MMQFYTLPESILFIQFTNSFMRFCIGLICKPVSRRRKLPLLLFCLQICVVSENMKNFIHVLFNMNSAVNRLVYAVLKKDIKNELKKMALNFSFPLIRVCDLTEILKANTLA